MNRSTLKAAYFLSLPAITMPPGSGNQTKVPPRGPRKPQAISNTLEKAAGVSKDIVSQPATPERAERRRRPSRRTQPKDIPTFNQLGPMAILESPAAPVPAQSATFDGTSDSPAPSGHSNLGKKTPKKSQTNGRGGSSTPRPRINRSPRSEQRPSSVTPAKSNNTPIQAYAGPTFHASPAPSSLPIPRFFSKSVPATEKGTSLKAMMQDDSSEKSSDKSDDSPTMRSSLQVSEQLVREASPLDVFFNADREEKARRSVGDKESPLSQSIAHPANIPKSVSPIPEYMRNHSRHPTGESIGGVFAMEMDASEKQNDPSTIRAIPQFVEAHQSESSPAIVTTEAPNPEERAKAKTEALKKLLLTPQPQRPVSASASPANLLSYSGSPSYSPFPKYERSQSVSSTSGSSLGNSNQYLRNQQIGNNFASPQQSPTALAKSLAYRARPLSSQLRRELPYDSENNELTYSPSPSRTFNVFNRTISQNSHIVEQNGHTAPTAPVARKFQPEDALKVATGQDSISLDVIENELRRVLKLELLSGGGATGVRS